MMFIRFCSYKHIIAWTICQKGEFILMRNCWGRNINEIFWVKIC